MLEIFTETSGRQRCLYGLIGIGLNSGLLFFAGILWFFPWAIAIVLLLSCIFGEW